MSEVLPGMPTASEIDSEQEPRAVTVTRTDPPTISFVQQVAEDDGLDGNSSRSYVFEGLCM